MGSLAAGSVILVRFPFSDLSHSKLRPAVVLADCGRGDWLLCQVTSNAYADSRAVRLAESEFQTGSLRVTSYARPAKLFTAHECLIVTSVATLHPSAVQQIIDAVCDLLEPEN